MHRELYGMQLTNRLFCAEYFENYAKIMFVRMSSDETRKLDAEVSQLICCELFYIKAHNCL